MPGGKVPQIKPKHFGELPYHMSDLQEIAGTGKNHQGAGGCSALKGDCHMCYESMVNGMKMYAVVNPFTTGAYILGAAILLPYVMYDDRIMKALLDGFYGWVILISFIVITGMTSVWELCIYAAKINKCEWYPLWS